MVSSPDKGAKQGFREAPLHACVAGWLCKASRGGREGLKPSPIPRIAITVRAAQAPNAPAADDAFDLGAQDDLEQYSQRVGRGAGSVVAVAGIKAR